MREIYRNFENARDGVVADVEGLQGTGKSMLIDHLNEVLKDALVAPAQPVILQINMTDYDPAAEEGLAPGNAS